ncbi:MAG: OmpA family protein [Burkholderiales bacterium]|nr:OmpA family protein [Burkholderiales bacterium]
MHKMTRSILAAALGFAAVSAFAAHDGYADSSNGTVVRSNYGLCWHTNGFTPEKAIAECDPSLMPKQAAAAPAPAAPAVVAAPAAPAPAAPKKVETITLNASSLFDTNKSVLKPEGKEALDSVAKVLLERKYDPAKTKIEIDGHADRMGKADHNLKLSQERADATQVYLVSKGVPASMITAVGKGSTQPITKPEDCKKFAKKKAKLISCYAPDRRVEVSIYAAVEQ